MKRKVVLLGPGRDAVVEGWEDHGPAATAPKPRTRQGRVLHGWTKDGGFRVPVESFTGQRWRKGER